MFKTDYDDSLGYDDTVERLFFPVRWVPYEDDTQLERNEENKDLWTPNDSDKVRLAQFARFVASRLGCHDFKLPDLAQLGFECMKDIHPAFEWKDVSSIYVWMLSLMIV